MQAGCRRFPGGSRSLAAGAARADFHRRKSGNAQSGVSSLCQSHRVLWDFGGIPVHYRTFRPSRLIRRGMDARQSEIGKERLR